MPSAAASRLQREQFHIRVITELPLRAQVSPLQRIAKLGAGAAGLLPPATLFHGTADATVPVEQSARMAEAWAAAGARLSLVR